MSRGVDSGTRAELQEAIREIEGMAGLTEATPRLRVGRPSAAVAAQQSPFAARGFKSVRGGVADAGPRPGGFDGESLPRALAIGITSPNYKDGKTTMAISLASCLAHDFSAQVMLVDADFQTHSVGNEYGLQGRPGLSDVLDGTATLPAVVNRFRQAPMTVVTAGSVAGDPARLARSERLPSVIDQMKRSNGFVVMDLPATLKSMNAPVIANRCDGVIVVVRAGKTTRRDLERVLELLQDANIIGVVINRQHSNVPGWIDRLLALPR